jgi:hypothetical protein
MTIFLFFPDFVCFWLQVINQFPSFTHSSQLNSLPLCWSLSLSLSDSYFITHNTCTSSAPALFMLHATYGWRRSCFPCKAISPDNWRCYCVWAWRCQILHSLSIWTRSSRFIYAVPSRLSLTDGLSNPTDFHRGIYTSVNMHAIKIAVFWNVTSCSLEDVYKRFGETFIFHALQFTMKGPKSFSHNLWNDTVTLNT